MRISVDPELCAGHALCQARAPQLFDLDIDGHASAAVDVPPPELEAPAREAAEACPEQAIMITQAA